MRVISSSTTMSFVTFQDVARKRKGIRGPSFFEIFCTVKLTLFNNLTPTLRSIHHSQQQTRHRSLTMCKWIYDNFKCGHILKRRVERCPRGRRDWHPFDVECQAFNEQFPDEDVNFPCQHCMNSRGRPGTQRRRRYGRDDYLDDGYYDDGYYDDDY